MTSDFLAAEVLGFKEGSVQAIKRNQREGSASSSVLLLATSVVLRAGVLRAALKSVR